MRGLRLIWSRCLNPILKWKNRGRSHHGLTDFISSHLVPRAFLDCDWSRRGIKTYILCCTGSNLILWSGRSVCWADPCKISSKRAPAFIEVASCITAPLPFKDHPYHSGWLATMHSLQASTHMSPFTIESSDDNYLTYIKTQNSTISYMCQGGC